MAKLLLTRSVDDNAALGRLLAGVGHEPIAIATTQIRPLPVDISELQRDVSLADALALTSRNGAQAAIALLGAPALRGFLRAGRIIAVVGAATAAALEAAGVSPTIVAEPATSAGLAQALVQAMGRSGRVVALHGDRTRPELQEGLLAAGASFAGFAVYRNEAAAAPDQTQVAAAAEAELVLIFAPSAAERLYGWLPQLRATPAVAIGPTTADALARWHGVSAASMAEGPGLPALLVAIDAALAIRRAPTNSP